MNIPEYVLKTVAKLQKNGFDAYIVGGCVRDLLMKKQPGDWDVTTKARPEEILALFF